MLRSLPFVLLLCACGTTPSSSDGGALDAGPDAGLDAGLDASVFDAAPIEAGMDATSATDAGADASPSDGGLGPLFAITDECGVLDTELTDTDPHWVQNASVFTDGWALAQADRLSAGAQTILAEGTAGGSSGYSEAFAFEVLHRCEGASLVATETNIRYSVPMPGSITDILVEIDGLRIGVSVTRAVTVTGMCSRSDAPDTTALADLLTRKLSGVNESSMLVAPEHQWVKQILFVYADTSAHAAAVMSAWSSLDATLRADTILFVSVSEAMDGFIYFEDRCP